MKKKNPSEGLLLSEVIEDARWMLDRLRKGLKSLILQIENACEEDPTAISKNIDIKSYQKAIQQAITAEEKLAQLGTEFTKIESGALDLDAARAEIFDRLARIKADRGDRGDPE